MSVKVMGLIWDCDLPPNHKLVLLAYADHADHDGGNIWPAVDRIASKTSYSKRQVQRTTAELVDAGHLARDGKGPKGTNKYRIPLENLPLYGGGDNMTPPDAEGVTFETERGDILTPGVTSATWGGDIAVSPDPSLNHHIETSKNHQGEGAAEPPDSAIPDMVNALVDATGMSGHLNWKTLSPLANDLLSAEYLPEQVVIAYGSGGWWQSVDWRGKRGDLPTAIQVRETIRTATRWSGQSAGDSSQNEREARKKRVLEAVDAMA